MPIIVPVDGTLFIENLNGSVSIDVCRSVWSMAPLVIGSVCALRATLNHAHSLINLQFHILCEHRSKVGRQVSQCRRWSREEFDGNKILNFEHCARPSNSEVIPSVQLRLCTTLLTVMSQSIDVCGQP